MTQLTPSQQSFIDAQLAAGYFPTAADVVEAAFDLLRVRQGEYDQLAEAIRQVQSGDVAELDVAEIKARGRQRLGRR